MPSGSATACLGRRAARGSNTRASPEITSSPCWLAAVVSKSSSRPPPPERRREPSPLDEDEARFRTAEDFPEKSWLQLRELIACAEEGPGHPREPLRLWLPAGGSFRLSRHREDGSVHDYRSDVKPPARQPAASAGSRGRT